MYAAGAESPQKVPCQNFLGEMVSGAQGKNACTNSEVLQEILHRYVLIGARSKGFLLFDLIMSLGLPILPVEIQDLVCARNLLEETDALSSRDAVHLGVMQNNGISKIATFDKGFRRVPWVQVINPMP